MKRKECDKLLNPGRPPSGWWIGLAAVAGLGLGPVASLSAGNLRFVERATISGPQVTLGDVAYLEGFFDTEQEAALAAMVLCEAPAPGRRQVVETPELRETLYRLGVNLGEVLLSGSTRVEIRRPHGADDLAGGHSEAQEDHPLPNAAPTLEAYLREHIAEQFADYGGRVEVQFSRTQAANTALSFTRPEFDFRVLAGAAPKLGLVSYAVEVFKETERLQTLHILANVSLVRTVVVAARPINRAGLVDSEDIRMSEQRFVRLDQIGETDSRLIVGQEARRFIERGELISLREVKATPLVRRNELVTVWNRRGAVVVRTVGKALGTGALGEEIEVKSERSGKRYLACVTGMRTVEVGDAGEPKVVRR